MLQRIFLSHKKTAAVIVLCALVAAIMWMLTMSVLGLIFCFLGVVLSLFLHIHYRMIEQNGARENIYRQLQALQNIHELIDIRSPLPAMGKWAASPDFMQIIAQFILEKKPKYVLECGSGMSSVVIGYLLEKNGQGKLVSLEASEQYANASKRLIAQHGLGDWVEVRYAPSEAITIKNEERMWFNTVQIANIEQVDVLVVDGPVGDRYGVLPLLFDKISAGGVVIVDDCGRQKDGENVRRWCEEFEVTVEWIATEKGTAILHKK